MIFLYTQYHTRNINFVKRLDWFHIWIIIKMWTLFRKHLYSQFFLRFYREFCQKTVFWFLLLLHRKIVSKRFLFKYSIFVVQFQYIRWDGLIFSLWLHQLMGKLKWIRKNRLFFFRVLVSIFILSSKIVLINSSRCIYIQFYNRTT